MKRRGIRIQLMAALLAIALGGCNRSAAAPPPSPYASAEQIEMSFRGQSFSLADDDKVAILTLAPGSGPKNRVLKLPFWLGTNILVPGVLQPKEGDYYVISEAVLVKTLGSPDQWLIEAGSSLIKKETVLITTRTHFRPPSKIAPETLPKLLPMIVQFAGTRPFTRGDGKTVEIPMLKEVSLPMKWRLAGAIPGSYARFEVR